MKWFRHDSNAHNDAKLQKILMRHGAQGYALYWYCLELIAGKVDSQNYTFELEHDAEILAHQLKIDTLLVEKIMTDMVELGLFESSAGKIYCLKMLRRLDDHTSRNPEIRKIIAHTKSSNTKLPRSDFEDAPKNLGADNITLDNKYIYAQFNRFWDQYPRKKNRKEAEESFIKLQPNDEVIGLIEKNISDRLESGEWEEQKFIPYPAKYLTNSLWLDEPDGELIEESVCH